MDDLYLDSSFICYTIITVTLLAGSLIQFVLILWCWWSLCGTTVKAQALIQRKIERLTSKIFFFDGASFLSCAVVAGCAFISFSVRNRNIPVSILEQPMLLSLDSYSSDPEVAKSWNQLQVICECCGVHKNSDWFGRSFHGYSRECDQPGFPNNVPDSCCKQLTIDCGRNITNPENIYQVGCLKCLAIHIDQQVRLTIESWYGECLTFFGLFTLWFGSVSVYVCVCVCMCRKYKVFISSATDKETVPNVEDVGQNKAVKSLGADNDDTKIDIEGECKNSDKETVPNVEDVGQNKAVKSLGADNDDTKIDIEGECKNSDKETVPNVEDVGQNKAVKSLGADNDDTKIDIEGECKNSDKETVPNVEDVGQNKAVKSLGADNDDTKIDIEGECKNSDKETVPNVVDVGQNKAVKSLGADNDDTKIDIEGECKNSDRLVDVAIGEGNESIVDVCRDTSLCSEEQALDTSC